MFRFGILLCPFGNIWFDCCKRLQAFETKFTELQQTACHSCLQTNGRHCSRCSWWNRETPVLLGERQAEWLAHTRALSQKTAWWLSSVLTRLTELHSLLSLQVFEDYYSKHKYMVSTEGRRVCLLLFQGWTFASVHHQEGGTLWERWWELGCIPWAGCRNSLCCYAAGGIWPADLSPLSYPFLLGLVWSGNPWAGML